MKKDRKAINIKINIEIDGEKIEAESNHLMQPTKEFMLPMASITPHEYKKLQEELCDMYSRQLGIMVEVLSKSTFTKVMNVPDISDDELKEFKEEWSKTYQNLKAEDLE